MNIFPLKAPAGSNESDESVSNRPDPLHLQDNGFHAEGRFKEMLTLERKRTERSGKSLLLMLVNIEKIHRIEEKNDILEQIASVLFSSTRETDIKGWYEHDSVIGVVFTEMNGIDKTLIKQKIYSKVTKKMHLKWAGKIKISFHLFPEEHDKEKPGGPPDLSLYPDLSKKRSSRKTSFILKRAVDILGSIVGLIIASPFFILIAILIKATSKGPVLFRQERVGYLGNKFTFLKFRSMVINNDDSIHKEYIQDLICEQKSVEPAGNNGGNGSGATYKLNDDPRVTPVGMFLRKTSLDELPQFLNVLKGDMSLVGPRPPIPYELKHYDIWHRRRILETKPGITGIWQTQGRSSTTFDEMVRLDIQYSREWSLWLDIKILFRTPWVVLTGKGAY